MKSARPWIIAALLAALGAIVAISFGFLKEKSPDDPVVK